MLPTKEYNMGDTALDLENHYREASDDFES